MNTYPFTLGLFLLSIFCIGASSAAPEPRERMLLDHSWKFIQSDVKGAERQRFDDRQWRTLNLPHDWSIEGEFREDAPTKGNGGYLPTGIGWYRKHLRLPTIRKQQESWIEFDGVYMNSDVWINGHHLGTHPYGYTGFSYDLTPFLSKGENIIAVRVDNSVQPNSRWYSGAGIYRHVWLDSADPVHVAQWGTYITTPSVGATAATVAVRTSIENRLAVAKNGVLRSAVVDGAGKEIAVVETSVSLAPSRKTDIDQTIDVASPALWSIGTPSALWNSVSREQGPSPRRITATPKIKRP